MKNIQEMHKTISGLFYNKIKKFCAPLRDSFGVNQFCYYRLTNSGHYAFVGLYPEWEEYYFSENQHLLITPFYRHPHNFRSGLISLNTIEDEHFEKLLRVAKEKFNVNFSLQFINKVADGIEAFGFGLKSSEPLHHLALFNELSLLRLFTNRFKEEFHSLHSILEENQIDIASLIGPAFHKVTIPIMPRASSRTQLLKKMGIDITLPLTSRETDVVKNLLKGYSASQIADELLLSKRTVEYYLERIKDKLCCFSRSDMIQKARELELLGYLGIQ